MMQIALLIGLLILAMLVFSILDQIKSVARAQQRTEIDLAQIRDQLAALRESQKKIDGDLWTIRWNMLPVEEKLDLRFQSSEPITAQKARELKSGSHCDLIFQHMSSFPGDKIEVWVDGYKHESIEALSNGDLKVSGFLVDTENDDYQESPFSFVVKDECAHRSDDQFCEVRISSGVLRSDLREFV